MKYLAFLFVIMLAGQVSAADLLKPAGRTDRPHGSESAPITLIEYSSPTCHHCVEYRNKVAPRIDAEFVQSGKVKLLFRPLVRNSVDMVIFALAETLPAERYDDFIANTYKRYEEIANSDNMEKTLRDLARDNGIDKDAFDAAIKNQDVIAALNDETQQAVQEFGVSGTPSFFINGDLVSGGLSYDEMKTKLEGVVAQ